MTMQCLQGLTDRFCRDDVIGICQSGPVWLGRVCGSRYGNRDDRGNTQRFGGRMSSPHIFVNDVRDGFRMGPVAVGNQLQLPHVAAAACRGVTHKVAELQRQINEERNAIRHLKAEWSLLNKPDRLQGLVERYNDYLQLEALDVKQIVAPADLPARPVMLEPIGGSNQMGGYAGSSAAIQ